MKNYPHSELVIDLLQVWTALRGKPHVAAYLGLKSTETLDRWIRDRHIPESKCWMVGEATKKEIKYAFTE